MSTITIHVDGQAVMCTPGRPLLNELMRLGFVVQTACGGQASCHLCRVTVTDHATSPPANAIEKRALGNVLIAQNMRLSCQVTTTEGLAVTLPEVETPEARRERIRRARERKRREGER